MARPKKQVDEALLEKLASIQCTNEELSNMVGVSIDTLLRRYATLIKKARDNGKKSLRRMQWEAAQKGNVTMLIWLGKQYLGQKDKIDFAEDDGFEFSDKEKV